MPARFRFRLLSWALSSGDTAWGRAGVGGHTITRSPLSPGSPWGAVRAGVYIGGGTGSLGRELWEEKSGLARALEHLTPRSGVKGGAHHGTGGGLGWGGQGLGQNPRSCQESMSVRPQRTCREPPADHLS